MRNFMRNVLNLKLYNILELSLQIMSLITLLYTCLHIFLVYDKRINLLLRYLISFIQRTVFEILSRRRFDSFDSLLQYTSYILNEIKISRLRRSIVNKAKIHSDFCLSRRIVKRVCVMLLVVVFLNIPHAGGVVGL